MEGREGRGRDGRRRRESKWKNLCNIISCFLRYGHAFMTGSLFSAGTESLSTLTDLIEVLVN